LEVLALLLLSLVLSLHMLEAAEVVETFPAEPDIRPEAQAVAVLAVV
jgi:hypothetical protein